MCGPIRSTNSRPPWPSRVNRCSRKVLVANRGEIACRIMQACRELGLRTVAVYSEADRDALHVRLADEAVCIGAAAQPRQLPQRRQHHLRRGHHRRRGHPPRLRQPLRGRQLRRGLRGAARSSSSGPPSDVIAKMGDKAEARRAMRDGGRAGRPGQRGRRRATCARPASIADELGYPVHDQGRRRRRRPRHPRRPQPRADRPRARAARTEARAAFGNGDVYLEKYLEEPRHVEVQILADEHGNVVHLGERDCSIQHRHQKLLEEVALPGGVQRAAPRAWARPRSRPPQAVGYVNAGTVEFLLDSRGRFYFIEMNTRIQVEHPVTEMLTGVDIVARADPHRRRREAGPRAGPHLVQRPRPRVPHPGRRRRPRLHRPRRAPSPAGSAPPGRACAWTAA